MNAPYTPEDFARCFSLRGYGKRKDALKWCETHGVNAPTEEDFERCWRDLMMRQPIRSHRPMHASIKRRIELEGFEYSEVDV